MNRKEVLIIAIATFITLVAWVFFDIIHTRANVEISTQLQEVTKPLDPNFDTEAIQLLQ